MKYIESELFVYAYACNSIREDVAVISKFLTEQLLLLLLQKVVKMERGCSGRRKNSY